MMIRRASVEDEEEVSGLIADFRVELRQFRGVKTKPDAEKGRGEFREYLDRGYPVFVAEDNSGIFTGYMVCRISGNVVWVESIYVLRDSRRKGVATELYGEAEKLSAELGGETVYNWVHPNNSAMIEFLAERGYGVLNLIEIRKPLKNEIIIGKIRVGDHQYDY